MGSEATLEIGCVTLAYGKNEGFPRFDHLYRIQHRTELDYVGYDVVDGKIVPEPVVEKGIGFSRLLRDLVHDLEWQGYTEGYARREVKSLFDQIDLTQSHGPDAGQLIDAFIAIDLRTPVNDHRDPEFAFSTATRHELRDLVFTALGIAGDNRGEYSAVIEGISTESLLRILAINPANLELGVEWRIADVLDGGWIDEEELTLGEPGPAPVLLLTEGSSDSLVLQHALRLQGGERGETLRFIDLEDKHPFSGTPNLHNFCRGLLSIGFAGLAIVIFDNDTEGTYWYERTQKLKLPPTFRILKLPNLSDFAAFETVGPAGTSRENVNGRAASIELYLDHQFDAHPSPVVRWTSYNESLRAYQGVLENKDSYLRRFLKLRADELPNYRFGRLSKVLELIEAAAIELRSGDEPGSRLQPLITGEVDVT